MDRRRRILNFREEVTRKLLGAAAEKNGAQVFSKLRIADVLELDGSGLDGDLFTYGLKAHFDFVVADAEHLPLFAVEFDGPHHGNDVRSAANDWKKNRICERLGLPLARVRDEHLFQRARGIDYLTWLTEVFFWDRVLAEAQDRGLLPEDEPADPMMLVYSPNVPGRFPLFISAAARVRIQRLHKEGLLGSSVPLHVSGDDSRECTSCFAAMPTTKNSFLFAVSSIYLRDFGISPSEASDEVATVNLAHQAEEYRATGRRAVSAAVLRNRLVRFLRDHSSVCNFGGSTNCELGFSISYRHDGTKGRWCVGPLGADGPAFVETR